jgi:hypothetical protein
MRVCGTSRALSEASSAAGHDAMGPHLMKVSGTAGCSSTDVHLGRTGQPRVVPVERRTGTRAATKLRSPREHDPIQERQRRLESTAARPASAPAPA